MNPVPHSRPWITDADVAAVGQALASRYLGQGSVTAKLEDRLSEWIGAAGGVAVGSGSAALVLALHAAGCGPGDEVVLPTYVCRELMEAIVTVGSKPVFCDCGPNWVVEPDNVAGVLTPRCRAILLPHLYGLYADAPAFRAFGRTIIEDFAQALGPPRQPALVGEFGVFSFHPTKCLTAGEGGLCAAQDRIQLGKLRRFRDGTPAGDASRLFSPLSDLSAALALSQLDRYPEFLTRRAAIARTYAETLGNSTAELAWFHRRGSMYFRFPIHCAGGIDAVVPAFAAHGVIVRRGVDELLHRAMGENDDRYPHAVRHYLTTVSLPIHPSLSNEEIARCVSAIRDAFPPRN